MTDQSEMDALLKRLRGRIRDTPGYRFGDDPAIMEAEDSMLDAADAITTLTAERDALREEVGRLKYENEMLTVLKGEG